jgi:L-threonylcarbamoyladenylate synthase
VDPNQPEPESIRRAAKVVIGGGIVVFPTRGLYGLAVNALDDAAIENVYRIKARSGANPILVLLPGADKLERMVNEIPASALVLMDTYWSGNVTLVFNARAEVSHLLTAGTGKIGVRLPGHPVARALTTAVGSPITGTSANISGAGGCARIDDLDPEIFGAADMILDAGPLQGGVGSTVIDVTCAPPRILREGVVPAADIFSLF